MNLGGRAIALCCLGLLTLSACQSTQEMAREDCADYGFKPGTDAFAQCVQKTVTESRQRLQRQINCNNASFAAQGRARSNGADLSGQQSAGNLAYSKCMAGGW